MKKVLMMTAAVTVVGSVMLCGVQFRRQVLMAFGAHGCWLESEAV